MLEEFIPQVCGKVGGNSSQDGEEMRLECSDCALCSVATMHVRGDELVAGFPNFRDDALIFPAGLVVKYLEVNFVAKGSQPLAYGGVCLDAVLVSLCFERDVEDTVAVNVVGDHYILIAAAGADWEAASIIGVEFMDWLDTDVDFVC